MITFRKITYSDITDIALLIYELLSELGEVYVEEDVTISLVNLLPSDDYKCYGAFDGEKLVGAMAVFIIPELWNHKKMTACESFWFVKKKYRGKVGKLLLEYLQSSIKNDASVIRLGFANSRILPVVERMGFVKKKDLVEKVI